MSEPSTPRIITDESGRKYKEVPVRSAIPIWVAAAVWLIAACLVPMTSLLWILLVAICAAAAAILTRRFLPKETRLVEIPFYSGSDDLDTTVREIGRALDAIFAACDKFSEQQPTIAAQFRDIATIIKKIRDAVIAQPEDLSKIRRFLNYYLPLTVKLAEKYALLRVQGGSGSNASEALHSIENVLPQIDASFHHQLDAMYADDALDISTDITVLETMLSRDNLL